jgi:hypothetical protein
MAQRGITRGSPKREWDSAPAQATGAAPTGESDRKKVKTQKAFCFSFFSTDGCARGDKCRFWHGNPNTEGEKSLIREGLRARKAVIRPDVF